MQIRTKTAVAILVAAAATMLSPGSVFADPINVNVNGQPVQFNGAPPMEVDGSVLVPLRGVFEAMGAGVNYDSVTHTITAKKGTTEVVLPLGSSTASVNGQAQTLSQPARVQDGTTLVPLRFVAEALGGTVDWHAADNTVAIRTPEEHLAMLPPAPGAGSVIGQLTGVFTDTNPQQVTLRVNGQDTTISITASTVILKTETGQPTQQLALSDIAIGDQVTVQRDDQGQAARITLAYGELKGTVKSIDAMADGSHVIKLNDGTSAQVAPNAAIRMNGRDVQISDIMPDEPVIIRLDPANNVAYRVVVNPGTGPIPSPVAMNPEAAGPVVLAFDVSADHPFRSGDVLTATLKGTQGGSAVIAIPGISDTIALTEVSPGIYKTDFKIPDGVAVNAGTVVARLTVIGHTSPLIQASEPVTIDSIPPRITHVVPARDSHVEGVDPIIYAGFVDTGGIGIDTNKTRVSLDGQDVSGSANIATGYLDFKPGAPLATGAHTVKITLVDTVGNSSTTEWPFIVSSHRAIDWFRTSAPAGSILSAGNVVKFSLQGPQDARVSATIIGVASNIPLHEEQPGLYRGAYTVQQGDNASEAPIVAHVVFHDGNEVTLVSPDGIHMAAGAPASPVIVTPTDGASIGSNLAVAGTAPPYSVVRVRVEYNTKAAANLVPMKGTAGERETTADENGNWTVDSLPLYPNTMFQDNANTRYNVAAVTVGTNGDRSAASTISVEGGKVYAHRRGQD